MRVLITGATGFIGRHLVERLSNNNEMFCLVRPTSNISFLKPFNVSFIYGDLSNYSSLAKIRNIDIIYHCAGYVGNDSLSKLRKSNIIATENICKIALEINVDRLIYLSSIAVISGNKTDVLTEDLPYSPNTKYAASKIEAEKVALKYRKKGLKIVILRPCIVYGKHDPHFTKRIIKLLRFRIIPLLGSGKNKLHLVYVKNLVEVMIYSSDKEEFLNGTFIVADKEVLSLREILEIMSKALHSRILFKIPEFLVKLLYYVPFIDKKIARFRKNREYSIKKLTLQGFKHSFSTRESLLESCRNFK